MSCGIPVCVPVDVGWEGMIVLESPTDESFSETFVPVGEPDPVLFWGRAVSSDCSGTGRPCSRACLPTSEFLSAEDVGSFAGRPTAKALPNTVVRWHVCHKTKLWALHPQKAIKYTGFQANVFEPIRKKIENVRCAPERVASLQLPTLSLVQVPYILQIWRRTAAKFARPERILRTRSFRSPRQHGRW